MRLKRRDFLRAVASAPVLAAIPFESTPHSVLVNDEHTNLNPTWVERIVRPSTPSEIQDLVKSSQKHRKVISVSGSRHATGGQQFAADSILLDMRSLNRVLNLDMKAGVLHVESGIEWPELIQGYLVAQHDEACWGIRQKQGGGDRMSLGGALSANAHGHDLGTPPIISDVEWIEIVTSDGSLRRCSRKENSELFSLAIGGYGLFGIITAVGLRLATRQKVRRRVESRSLAELMDLVEKRTAAGAPFGYFQYSIDETSPEFLRTGIFTTYEPVPAETPLGKETTDVDEAVLTALLKLAHQDRKSAYRHYATIEFSKDGNVEWSDLHQLSTYPQGYHKQIESQLGKEAAGADLILEVYIPRSSLISFLEAARRLLLKSDTPLIYGTVRFIEQDRDSFLAWAKKRYACVIFAPHFSRETHAMKKAEGVCRQLLREGIDRDGSFYLTYNRFATRNELDSAYPQFADFLNLKRKYDPGELFQSEWYRFYRALYV